MTYTFYKYHGTGNDFILIDNRNGNFDRNDNHLVKLLCHRRFGIGADGLMLLNEHEDYDFEMVYYNSDGFEGSMCGNGGRCIVAFAKKMGVIKDKTIFIASDGEHKAELKKNSIKLKMNDVSSIDEKLNGYFLDTGSPHYVELVKDVYDLDVNAKGREIRNSIMFEPDGTNVNFISLKRRTLSMRTYERGVESETLSCGTGAVASALVLAKLNDLEDGNIGISVPGGNLKVHFEKGKKKYKNIWLEGPAAFVFEGSFSTD